MKAGHTISSLSLTICLLFALAFAGSEARASLDPAPTPTPSGAAPAGGAAGAAENRRNRQQSNPAAQANNRGRNQQSPANRGQQRTVEPGNDDAGETTDGSERNPPPGAGLAGGGQNQTTPRASPATNADPAVSNEQRNENGWLDTILYWGLWFVSAVGVVLLITFVAYSIKTFIDNNRARTEGHFASLKNRQEEFARQTREALTTLNTSVNNRMAELQAEVRELHRSVQDDNRAILDGVRRASATSAYATTSASYGATPSRFEKEEPSFPAPADEYLNKSRRGAVVVKPDFQNGILVQDAEGNGEFVLVRDHTAPDELLYVIPRTGYFQTKQDFYNYYDKYYDCHRPSSGAVWIIQPAVVDRVSGGWALRERGELEMR